MVDFAEVPGVPCPCGLARRAFADVPEFPATIHVTEISPDAKLHYHRILTETYYVLECENDAQMQLDDEIIPVRPGVCVMIPPGVRHRAIGRMKVLIVVFPKFDPADEWLD
ncbi:cupin domain-containing protein [Tundrisphaera lichenicola]|uniref:cupin domain-containing protein n=1 Tax=Tundrisphaera lichenicola TaxID=2029860 RepID=UPI003EBA2D7D